MENPEGSGEASAAGKGKKHRALSPSLVTWTGEKKAKIQGSTPTTCRYLAMIARGDRDPGGPEEIEGIDWDMDKLVKEIDCRLGRFKDRVLYKPGALDEQQLTALDQRLALFRLRGYEANAGLDDASLAALYPLSKLQLNDYYKLDEMGFEWYFDREYCLYAGLQDYQRLVLRDSEEYVDWEYYRNIRTTLEGDQ